MRKALALFLLSAHLLGNTEFGQFFRLPQLFSHYRQHCLEQKVSFLAFIVMHYGGDDGTTADDQEDSKLPCHQAEGDHSYLHAFTPSSNAVAEQLPPRYLLPGAMTVPADADLLTGFVNLVLQPPRA